MGRGVGEGWGREGRARLGRFLVQKRVGQQANYGMGEGGRFAVASAM